MNPIGRSTIVLLLAMLAPLARGENLLIVRGDGNYPPFEMVSHGQLTGLHIELVNLIARQLGDTVHWQSVPWTRAQSMLRSGEADAITFMSQTPERERYAIFLPDAALSTTRSAFITLAGTSGRYHWNGDLAALRGIPIGVLKGYAYSREFDNDPSLTKRLVVGGNEQLLQMLKAERFALAVGDVEQFRYLTRNDPSLPAIEFLDPPLFARPNYLAFSRSEKHMATAQRYAQAMANYKKTPAWRELMKRYLSD